MPSERQRARLAVIRARGRKAFIWRQGVLGYGLPWGVIMAAILPWLNGNDRPFPGRPLLRFATVLWLFVPLGMISGVFWGRRMWRFYESKNWYELSPLATERPLEM